MYRYVLYNGAGKFIRRDFDNKFVETDDIAYATQFHPLQKAERVLRNLPQDLADRYRIARLAPPQLEDHEAALALDRTPAVDAAPVVHGHWVQVHGFATPGGDPVWCCSVCSKGIHTYGIEHGTYGADIADGQWVSCPNCGAKMDDDWG